MKKSTIRNNKGMAIIEAVPLIVIFVMLLSFAMGFFGVVHTAILNSISARAYAFETFRDRTNLQYYREDGSAIDGSVGPLFLGLKQFRYHAIQHEGDTRPNFVPTDRRIALGGETDSQASTTDHNTNFWSGIKDGQRNETFDATPVWVMVGYGICLNAACGNPGGTPQ